MVVVYWVMWMSAVCMVYVAFSIVDSTIILRYIKNLKDQFQTIDFVCDHAKQFFSRNACPKFEGSWQWEHKRSFGGLCSLCTSDTNQISWLSLGAALFKLPCLYPWSTRYIICLCPELQRGYSLCGDFHINKVFLTIGKLEFSKSRLGYLWKSL